MHDVDAIFLQLITIQRRHKTYFSAHKFSIFSAIFFVWDEPVTYFLIGDLPEEIEIDIKNALSQIGISEIPHET